MCGARLRRWFPLDVALVAGGQRGPRFRPSPPCFRRRSVDSPLIRQSSSLAGMPRSELPYLLLTKACRGCRSVLGLYDALNVAFRKAAFGTPVLFGCAKPGVCVARKTLLRISTRPESGRVRRASRCSQVEYSVPDGTLKSGREITLSDGSAAGVRTRSSPATMTDGCGTGTAGPQRPNLDHRRST